MSSSRPKMTYCVGSKDGYWFFSNGNVGTITENHDWNLSVSNHKYVYNKKQLRKVLLQLKLAGCKEVEVDQLFSKRENGEFVTYMKIYDYHLEYYN